MTVPTPSVGQVIDAAAWGGVVATDVNGLLARATTLETQMAPLTVAGGVQRAYEALTFNNYLDTGAWANIDDPVTIPAVAYPRLAIVNAGILLTVTSGATHYYFGIVTTNLFGGTPTVQRTYGTSANIGGVWTLPANTVGTVRARIQSVATTATGVQAVGGAGYNWLDVGLLGVRALEADIP